MARKSIQERFWSKVDKSGDCWLWTAGRKNSNPQIAYGCFRVDGKTLYAHRLAWELTHGPIPPGLVACHKCDNPACVNPSHLFLGTQANNIRDCATKNRTTQGSRNRHAKLTCDQVGAIRADSRTQRQIAASYDVDTSLICKIKRRKIWAHL